MEGVEGIQDDGGGTGGIEGGGDLVADVSGFPHADNDDLAALVERFLQQLDGSPEGGIKPVRQTLQ